MLSTILWACIPMPLFFARGTSVNFVIPPIFSSLLPSYRLYLILENAVYGFFAVAVFA